MHARRPRQQAVEIDQNGVVVPRGESHYWAYAGHELSLALLKLALRQDATESKSEIRTSKFETTKTFKSQMQNRKFEPRLFGILRLLII
jgi:hypothetical protein